MPKGLHAALAALRSGKYPPPEGGAFRGLPASAGSKHLLAVGSDGAPCLLLHTSGAPRAVRPLRLQGLAVQYSVPCRVTVGKSSTARDEVLTTLVCTSQDPLEQDYFLHASELILRIIGQAPTIDEVVSATSHLATVFQRLSRPAQQTVTGVIGELVFIRSAAPPEDAWAAWRSAPADRYDFVRGNLRLEGKATQRRERAHQVSYDQCHPPTG